VKMAIAPLNYEAVAEELQAPRDRGHLRLVPDEAFGAGSAFLAPAQPEIRIQPRSVRTPAQRIAARRVIRRRRQVAMGALIAIAAIVISCLPIGVLGGQPTASSLLVGNATPGASLGIYTVQPGDSISSIAHSHASGQAASQLAKAIEVAVGSNTVVAGETINLNP